MTIEILMPALSPTIEEGTLAKWMVKEGDTVSSGDVIAEMRGCARVINGQHFDEESET